MIRSTRKGTQLAALALSTMLSATLFAQSSSTTPVDSTVPTTATSTGPDAMTKGDIKDQRKQQKRDENAANQNAKAAKAAAKAKKANDKALQAREKAGQVNTMPSSSDPR